MNDFSADNIGGSTITINGRTYSGKNTISINGNKVIIDGIVQNSDEPLVGPINVHIVGDVGNVSTISGDVHCGNARNVSTMSGDVTCNNINGSVKTVSGDIIRG